MNRAPILQSLGESSIEHLVDATKQGFLLIADRTADELASRFAKHRSSLDHSTPRVQDLIDVAALAVASMKAACGIELYETQIHAGWLIATGHIAEMQTGEGKTFACLLPACLMALDGFGVHVACPNDYLATRDHELLRPVLRSLGYSTASLDGNASAETKKQAYRCDVVYGAAHTFGFDYLRDQLSLQRWRSSCMTNRLLGFAQGRPTRPNRLQRGLNAAIVDEADHVLLDDAMSPMVLADSSANEASDGNVHRHARTVAKSLRMGTDFLVDPETQQVHLTQSAFDQIYSQSIRLADARLRRPWHDYVIAAIRAELLFRVQQDYVVRGGDVQIVDNATGRIYSDRNWSEGIHQAIEAKEGLSITEENSSLRRTTRQRFFGQYRWLGGMTGTAADCETEFRDTYRTPVQRVATRLPSRRKLLSLAAFHDVDQKYRAIACEARRCHQSGRAVLVGTLSINESQAIATVLDSEGLCHSVLNGVQDADEAAIIARAGRSGAITVATSLAGRGTDIQLDTAVRQAGGLHVVVSQHHRLARVDRQLIGRCARAGDPGTARYFVCPQDDLAIRYATWLQSLIRKRANTVPYQSIAPEVTRPIHSPACRLSQHIVDVQRVLQRQDGRQRRTAAAQQRENDRWQMGNPNDAKATPSYQPEATYV